eukprot:350834-Chlamydomonas_euryale.AAC.2
MHSDRRPRQKRWCCDGLVRNWQWRACCDEPVGNRHGKCFRLRARRRLRCLRRPHLPLGRCQHNIGPNRVLPFRSQPVLYHECWRLSAVPGSIRQAELWLVWTAAQLARLQLLSNESAGVWPLATAVADAADVDAGSTPAAAAAVPADDDDENVVASPMCSPGSCRRGHAATLQASDAASNVHAAALGDVPAQSSALHSRINPLAHACS